MPFETLAHRDGWLCVAYSDTEYSRPLLKTLYWPIARMSEAYAAEHYQLGAPVHHLGNGAYRTAGSWADTIVFRLTDGASTKPIHTAHDEIPPPKTRLPVKWERGAWKKQTKRGWVPV